MRLRYNYSFMVVPQKRSDEEELLRKILKEARTKCGLSQKDLSKMLGQSQSFVSKYEGCERQLKFMEVLRICEILKIDIADVAERVKMKMVFELEVKHSGTRKAAERPDEDKEYH